MNEWFLKMNQMNLIRNEDHGNTPMIYTVCNQIAIKWSNRSPVDLSHMEKRQILERSACWITSSISGIATFGSESLSEIWPSGLYRRSSLHPVNDPIKNKQSTITEFRVFIIISVFIFIFKIRWLNSSMRWSLKLPVHQRSVEPDVPSFSLLTLDNIMRCETLSDRIIKWFLDATDDDTQFVS